jgi:hypothetical protein
MEFILPSASHCPSPSSSLSLSLTLYTEELADEHVVDISLPPSSQAAVTAIMKMILQTGKKRTGT